MGSWIAAENHEKVVADAKAVIEAQAAELKLMQSDLYDAQLKAQDYKNRYLQWAASYSRLSAQMEEVKRRSQDGQLTFNDLSVISRAKHEEIVDALHQQLEQANDQLDDLNEKTEQQIEMLHWRLTRIKTTAMGLHDGLRDAQFPPENN